MEGKSCPPWRSWHCTAAWHALLRAWRVSSSEALADSKLGEEAETKTLLVHVLSSSGHVLGKSRRGSWLPCYMT